MPSETPLDQRLGIRDPYLMDAVDEYVEEYDKLRRSKTDEAVEHGVYLLCELARDMIVRLVPFKSDQKKVIRWVRRKLKATLKLLERKPTNENIQAYARHIGTRIAKIDAFLNTPKRQAA